MHVSFATVILVGTIQNRVFLVSMVVRLLLPWSIKSGARNFLGPVL